MYVYTVTDQLHIGDAVKGGSDNAGSPMKEGVHGVKHMCDMRCSRLKCCHSRIIVCLGVGK